MTTRARYTPENREIELSDPSLADQELLKSLRGNIQRGQQTLLCLQSPEGQDSAEMYIRFRNGKYWAVHFPGGAHGPHAIGIESPEHKRQKDYWQRAAEVAGYQVSQEFYTGNKTKLDVAIHGPCQTGIEVQRSYIEPREVKSRSTKSYRAGWLPFWFYDSDRTPSWSHEVPALGCNRLPWSSLPRPRAATATGLSHFEAVRCEPGEFNRCFDGKKRHCRDWHPKRRPWRGMTLDDVAERAPVGGVVPMMDQQGIAHLVSPENLGFYQSLSGLSGDYVPGSSKRAQLSSRATTKLCASPVHEEEASMTCHRCGNYLHRLRQLVRPRPDLCEHCRIVLGLPAPDLPMDAR